MNFTFPADWFSGLVDTIDLMDDQNTIRFDSVEVHPDFYKFKAGETDINGDIGLMHTTQNMTKLFPGSKVAKLPGIQDELIGKALVSGFGTTDKFPGVNSRFLLYLKLYITDRSFCTDRFSGFNPETMICAGHKEIGKETCRGDSGGGLMMMDDSGQDFLIGILSYGEGAHCGSDLLRAH